MTVQYWAKRSQTQTMGSFNKRPPPEHHAPEYGPFPTRDDALDAFWKAEPDARTAMSWYGRGFDIRWHERDQRLRAKQRSAADKVADQIDGYDRDDLGESPDY